MRDERRVLIVEDEPEIRELIALQLQRKDFLVTSCATAEEGLYLAQINTYDLFVLDWMLPGKSGVALSQEVRRGELNKETPILMVTARTEPEDIVMGLEAGADDYLTKPFEISVLMARVQALLKKGGAKANQRASPCGPCGATDPGLETLHGPLRPTGGGRNPFGV